MSFGDDMVRAGVNDDPMRRATAAVVLAVVCLLLIMLAAQRGQIMRLNDRLDTRQQSLEECMGVAHRQHRVLDEVMGRYGHLLTGVER